MNRAMSAPWCQVFVRFDDWAVAERIVATDLGPVLTDIEATAAISSWFFMRKKPCWRIRFLPPGKTAARDATALVHRRLTELQRASRITRWIETIYEPETHAFGGPSGMDIAHRLFHHDSR